MKTESNKEIGALGEYVAAKYLENKGFRVIERNYWKPYGEIDLICSRNRVIHFIEVKTVSREVNGGVTRETLWNPGEKIGAHKLGRMVRTIDTYVQERRLDGDWQMDAVLVELDTKSKKARVELLENISPYT